MKYFNLILLPLCYAYIDTTNYPSNTLFCDFIFGRMIKRCLKKKKPRNFCLSDRWQFHIIAHESIPLRLISYLKANNYCNFVVTCCLTSKKLLLLFYPAIDRFLTKSARLIYLWRTIIYTKWTYFLNQLDFFWNFWINTFAPLFSLILMFYTTMLSYGQTC